MTNKEAIKILRSLYNVQSLDTLTQEEMTAVAMAIKSLEAWEKVMEEIEETNFTELLHLSGSVEIIKIGVLNTIKNNLKEVSE